MCTMGYMQEKAFGGRRRKTCRIKRLFDGRPAFLQEDRWQDAGTEMQDELQETLLAIHGQTPKLCRIYKYRKRELYKIVEIPKEMRIMKTVRKR